MTSTPNWAPLLPIGLWLTYSKNEALRSSPPIINTDFRNMVNRDRLSSKKESKTEAVQSVIADRLDAEHIHVGASDYVPWQKDNKVCFIRIEGKLRLRQQVQHLCPEREGLLRWEDDTGT
jgi:hypothetical protein